MRKKFLFILMVVVALVAAGCSSPYGKYKDKISEIRDNVFEGSCDNFKVTAVSGKREQPFNIDGESGDVTDFTVITVTPKVFDISAAYTYKLSIGGEEYEGSLVRHPFNETYSTELGVRAKNDFVVEINGDACKIEMKSVKTDKFISAEKAFDVALDKLKTTVEKMPKYEIYIRLSLNPVNEQDGYYWYVAFVDGQNTYAALIDPETAEIVASRESND